MGDGKMKTDFNDNDCRLFKMLMESFGNGPINILHIMMYLNDDQEFPDSCKKELHDELAHRLSNVDYCLLSIKNICRLAYMAGFHIYKVNDTDIFISLKEVNNPKYIKQKPLE